MGCSGCRVLIMVWGIEFLGFRGSTWVFKSWEGLGIAVISFHEEQIL